MRETETIKTSRRDLAYVISHKLNGGTTVAGTLIVANKLGIPVFATGGMVSFCNFMGSFFHV